MRSISYLAGDLKERRVQHLEGIVPVPAVGVHVIESLLLQTLVNRSFCPLQTPELSAQNTHFSCVYLPLKPASVRRRYEQDASPCGFAESGKTEGDGDATGFDVLRRDSVSFLRTCCGGGATCASVEAVGFAPDDFQHPVHSRSRARDAS
ncbi:MAG TPA: hypothetical protein VMM76_04520 [Pirellulaceae bacterium]|nr:hypothetical protein [Pirellulaceae bacterium]